MSSAISQVEEAAAKKGFQLQVKTFPQSTKSASEAANALGISIGQIGKSLLFIAGGRPLLCISSGLNKVDEEKLSHLTGEEVRLGKALEVRELTGFSIGGVPPFGHEEHLTTFIDEDLGKYEIIYCAAGTPHAVFPIDPRTLQELTKGEMVDLKRE